MAITIPDALITKFNEGSDALFERFKVECQLVFIEAVEPLVGTFNNIPSVPSIATHKRSVNQIKVQDQTLRGVEKLENIDLKVYWDSKDFVKLAGNIVLPDGAIMTVCKAADLTRLLLAKQLIAHSTISEFKEYRFIRFQEPFPMAFGWNRYFGCFWERA